jgi:hypothetical protein
MPKFLEDKLKREYPNNPHAVYGTLNELGMMHGNKETAKGKAAEKKHEAKAAHPIRNLKHYAHPKRKSR